MKIPLFLASAPFAFGLIAAADGATPVIGGIVAGWLLAAVLIAWRPLAAMLSAALMGLGASVYLGVQHHSSSGPSICSVSETFDCDKVNTSEWSELAGIPIAFLGSGFYAAVAAIAAMALLNPKRYPQAGAFVVAGSTLALGYSALLAWASVQIGAWCLFCISMYGVNLLLLIAGLRQAKAAGTPFVQAIGIVLKGKQDRSLTNGLTAGVVVFVACMIGYQRLGPSSPAASTAEAIEAGAEVRSQDLAELFEGTEGPLELDGTEPVMGDPAAPYTLVEFADFECPYCGKVAPMLHDLVKNNPDIKVLFKHYPLSEICNDGIQGARHDRACAAAAATECARLQGRFWELDALLFANQQFLGEEELRFQAKKAGLDAETFEACMADERTMAAVRADVAHAQQVGVHGTPSLFLQGIKGDEWVSVKGVPEYAAVLVQAHKQGIEMPATPPHAKH